MTRGIAEDELLDRITRVFQTHGYDGASLTRISDATGLGRASLYHRFPGGKEEMAEAVLKRAEAWLRDHVLAALEGEGPPRERITEMATRLDAFYDGGRRSCLLDALSFGDEGSPFRKRIRSAMEGWVEALEHTLAEERFAAPVARRRAEEAVIRIQGALVVARATDDSTPFRRVVRGLPELLLRPVEEVPVRESR